MCFTSNGTQMPMFDCWGGVFNFTGQHKIEFIPDIVGPILQMTLIPENGKNCYTLCCLTLDVSASSDSHIKQFNSVQFNFILKTNSPFCPFFSVKCHVHQFDIFPNDVSPGRPQFLWVSFSTMLRSLQLCFAILVLFSCIAWRYCIIWLNIGFISIIVSRKKSNLFDLALLVSVMSLRAY